MSTRNKSMHKDAPGPNDAVRPRRRQTFDDAGAIQPGDEGKDARR